jgi:hypothetical protein
MATGLYDLGRQAFLDGDIDFSLDTINCVIVFDTYVPNLAMDQFYSSVQADIAAPPVTLTTKTTTNGVADADNVTFLAVAVSPTPIQYIVLFKDTGVAATSPLIALWDSPSGLPLIPSGSDIVIQWDNGASKIFKL